MSPLPCSLEQENLHTNHWVTRAMKAELLTRAPAASGAIVVAWSVPLGKEVSIPASHSLDVSTTPITEIQNDPAHFQHPYRTVSPH